MKLSIRCLFTIIIVILLTGCGGDNSSSNQIANDESSETGGVFLPGEISEVVSNSSNDANGNGIRDVVDESVDLVVEDERLKIAFLDAALKMQIVIDKYNSGIDIEESFREYKYSVGCLSILGFDDSGDPSLYDVDLLELIALAPSNNISTFESITKKYRQPVLQNIDLESCS